MESKLTTLLLADAVEKYSEDQPRDDHGRFGEGGGSKSSGNAREGIKQAKKEAVKASEEAWKATKELKGGWNVLEGRTIQGHPDDHLRAASLHDKAAEKMASLGERLIPAKGGGSMRASTFRENHMSTAKAHREDAGKLRA